MLFPVVGLKLDSAVAGHGLMHFYQLSYAYYQKMEISLGEKVFTEIGLNELFICYTVGMKLYCAFPLFYLLFSTNVTLTYCKGMERRKLSSMGTWPRLCDLT